MFFKLNTKYRNALAYYYIVCDLQYLYAVLALKLTCLRSLSFLMYYNCPHSRLSCPHTHSCWVSFLHFKIRSVCAIPSFVPHHLQSLSGNVSFFIPLSAGSFFFRWEVVLHSPVSLGFANPLSIHVMLFLHF